MTPEARRILDRVYPWHRFEDIPRYGSWAWRALPDQDPRRAAAVMIAAESWLDHISPERVAEDLRIDMQERDDELRRRVRGASGDVWHARDWPQTIEQVKRVDRARALRGAA